jgi:hypothetical protein
VVSEKKNLKKIDRLISKKSSLKLLGQFNRNLVVSIYGISSIQIAHFVPIHSQIWPPQAILLSDWSKLGRTVSEKIF